MFYKTKQKTTYFAEIGILFRNMFSKEKLIKQLYLNKPYFTVSR